MRKYVILLLAMSFLIVLAYAVMDKDNNAPGQMKMEQKKMSGNMNQRQGMMELLKLSDDQKKQIQTIMTNHKKEMNTMKADLDNLHIDQNNLLSQQKFDDAKRVVDQITAKQAQVEKTNIDTHKQIWNILTDEQKKIAQEHKMGMGMMGFDGPGPGGRMGHNGMKHQKMPPKNMQGCDGGKCPMNGDQCK